MAKYIGGYKLRADLPELVSSVSRLSLNQYLQDRFRLKSNLLRFY